jgi:hypothetical protein
MHIKGDNSTDIFCAKIKDCPDIFNVAFNINHAIYRIQPDDLKNICDMLAQGVIFYEFQGKYGNANYFYENLILTGNKAKLIILRRKENLDFAYDTSFYFNEGQFDSLVEGLKDVINRC